MELTAGWIDIDSDGATVRAYRARPARIDAPIPAIVVIQEIWGVDGHIQDMVRRYAEAGYEAIAPDLYAENGERPEAMTDARVAEVKAFLETVPPAVWQDPGKRAAEVARLEPPKRIRVGDTMGRLLGGDRPMDRWVGELRAVVAWLAKDAGTKGRRVGSVGYCMGGGLSIRLACAEPTLSGAVVYYGSAPDEGALSGIACPVVGFYGADDARITGGVPALEKAMKKAGKSYEAHVYEKTGHAFFNDTRKSYQPESARDAWAKTLAFFATNLTPPA